MNGDKGCNDNINFNDDNILGRAKCCDINDDKAAYINVERLKIKDEGVTINVERGMMND